MKQIKKISYKGYEIEIISKETALVICKRCKGKYIPFLSEEGCVSCIDNLKSRIVKEKEYILWDEEKRERIIKEETL